MIETQKIDYNDPVLVQDIFLKQEEKIRLLEEQIALFRSQLFGKKSEKYQPLDPNQMDFFLEDAEEVSDEDLVQEKIIQEHKRKVGRKAFPAELTRREVIHDIAQEEKQCSCGCELKRIGEETSQQLDYIPAKLEVIVNIRPKYACPSCEGLDSSDKKTVAIAPVPLQILPKTITTPSLLAHLITAKFVDALPFYRQEKQFQRLGVDLSRNNMINWTLKLGVVLNRLLELLHHEILSGDLIHIDETHIQVLKEKEKSASSKSYMWVLRGDAGVFFHYSPSREAITAQKLLEGYQGVVLSDGYSGYNFISRSFHMHHCKCWQHAKRKFQDVIKGKGKNGKEGNAQKAINSIRSLYRIEHEADKEDLTDEKRVELRTEKAVPLLDEFHLWLKKKEPQVPPSSLLGKAIFYSLNHWQALKGFLNYGFVPLDNNRGENAIRPYVIGRKNWLFCDTVQGAEAMAKLYSLIETAKALNLNPCEYLQTLFEKLPYVKNDEELKQLLPQYLKTKQE